MTRRTEALIDFLDNSPSTYHVIANLAGELDRQGYTWLEAGDPWQLQAGGKYYTTKGGSTLIAFRIPEGIPAGFMISASHADRPGLKVKEKGELTGKYTRLAVEKYGGLIMSTWLDRPLSVAGRVLVETEKGVQSKLINIDRDLLLIPNVAIHMNRKINEGYTWNPAVDLLPLLGSEQTAGQLEAELSEAAGGKILGRDLYLYVRQKASVWGVNNEYLSASGLDDLLCAWSCTRGFLEAEKSGSIPVLCVFDSEEVGSCSAQGAASTVLEDVLQRISNGCGLDCRSLLSQSFVLSADNAHALHPNHPELSDAANAPVMGGGVVLKFNANLRYTTDGVSAALFRKICQKANVPVQDYWNRADLPGGSTLGTISLGRVSVPSADIGIGQLAMHSSYETVASADVEGMIAAMAAFYGTTLRCSRDNAYILE